jgi:hypothetical protein
MCLGGETITIEIRRGTRKTLMMVNPKPTMPKTLIVHMSNL